MTDVKQVKVDNWGTYFLQRLKHFFNRTDYCDLTLQFQDNAQLKVHRLVLSACTEYFELLERTCEMYEDCLVMPDDLQADVVVPIVNFMYTGHLEFRTDLLEKLYQTSLILNMPVLTKLLESHRMTIKTTTQNYSAVKRFTKANEPVKTAKPTTSGKRSYGKAFDNNNVVYRERKVYNPLKLVDDAVTSPTLYSPSPVPKDSAISNKKLAVVDPRPTRYELPEELDTDNIFDNSFCNISYTCKPLMIHPDYVKSYSSKRSALFNEASSSKKLMPGTSTVDIVECKRIAREENIFDDNIPDHNLNEELDMYNPPYNNDSLPKDSSQLFDQILDDGPKVTIETKDSKAASNLDHAKIISEVLKKYPHLVKSNKNIKLKILNTPGKGKKQQQKTSPTYTKEIEKVKPKLKEEEPDYTYETDVIDSQQAAKLIGMGAENTKGPWICLICGTPGKALHFTSYYKFRRHLVDVHHEKPVSNICEYCGLRSLKRNYLLHHLYSQHGVEPPPQYNFPKCNRCNYIALTEGLLVKHKMTHKESKNFRCNVCSAPFNTTKHLLQHIQITGHKYSAERKTNLQCIYCLKGFLRDGNLYAHLKTYHRKEAKSDGIIDDSDDEKPTEEISRGKPDNRDSKYHPIKYEPSTSCDNDFEEVDVQYQIQQRHDGDLQVSPKKHNPVSNSKQKILNPGFGTPKPAPQKAKSVKKPPPEPINFLEDISIPSPPAPENHNEDEIVLIDNIEYIMRENQLVPRKTKPSGEQFIISDMMDSASLQAVQPTTSMDYTNVHNPKILTEQPNILMKKSTNINQPIQIVVSNEEEYKALMSSNHPILFDNGDANKTLTVLTAPHNTTIESATINLNNPQSNDMVIIQENYPLNVTEAVATDNSNIVVVYSHPVDDQNKQFQILTTGGIGSQFVQSSAIITQNYETVTTTTPIMSAHVLEQQPDTTWQDTVQGENIQQVPMNHQSQSLQNVVENVEVKPIENETSDDSSELPDVHLTPQTQTITPQENQVNVPIGLNDINTEHVNHTITSQIQEESPNLTETEIATNILRASVEESTAILEPIQIAHENENVQEVLTNDLNQEIALHEPMETSSIVEQEPCTEIIPQEEQVINALTVTENAGLMENVDPQNTLLDQQPLPESTLLDQQPLPESTLLDQQPLPESTLLDQQPLPESTLLDQQPLPESTLLDQQPIPESTLIDQEPLPESQVYDDIVDINHITKENPPICIKEAENKIKNLALEWSEDEYDVAEDVSTTVKPVHNAVVIPQPREPEKLEETIENIQKEVQNHIASIASASINAAIEPISEVDTEESENSIPEDTIPLPQETRINPEVTIDVQNIPQAQQKISSLLNDWEDNDSQEDSNGDVTIEVNKSLATELDNKDLTNPTITKAENIKSLVSDWDDEEEEIKNE